MKLINNLILTTVLGVLLSATTSHAAARQQLRGTTTKSNNSNNNHQSDQRQLQEADNSASSERPGGAVVAQTGTVGNGGGGSRFSDLSFLQNHGYNSLNVTQVSVSGRDLITCVETTYSDGSVRTHGRSCNSYRQVLALDHLAGEVIQSIEIWSTEHRFGVPPNCPYNSNFRSVSRVRVTTATTTGTGGGGSSIDVGRSSGHGHGLCIYTQTPHYARVDISRVDRHNSPRIAILGFHGTSGDLMDSLGVVTLEVPLFDQQVSRGNSIPESDFSTSVDTMLTRPNKNVFVHSLQSGRLLDELDSGRITTNPTNDGTTADWDFAFVPCPDRSYPLYANVLSGKICYNIRNPTMTKFLGNNGVQAFEHDGTGENDILGSYVLETDDGNDCRRDGSTIKCQVQIVSSFYTDRRVVTDYHEGSASDYLQLPPTPSRLPNWELVFLESFDFEEALGSVYHPIHFRNLATAGFLNRGDNNNGLPLFASVLDYDNQFGDRWVLSPSSQPCPGVGGEECHSLMNYEDNEIRLDSIRIEQSDDCYFATADGGNSNQQLLACPVRLVRNTNSPSDTVCLTQDNSSGLVSFVDCDGSDLLYNEWLLYF